MVFLIAVAAGCAKPIHASTFVGPQTPVVVGSELVAGGSWTATCTESILLAKSEPKSVPCEHKPVRIEVECDGACEVIGPYKDEDPKFANVRVLATRIGMAAVRISNTRVDSGANEVKSFGVEVVAPERLALDCEVDTSHMPCGPEGVSAQKPLIYPQVFVRDHQQWSHQLIINGKTTHVSASSPALSLAELFPEARQGDGIAPGTYLVELALAGLVEKFQVVAR